MCSSLRRSGRRQRAANCLWRSHAIARRCIEPSGSCAAITLAALGPPRRKHMHPRASGWGLGRSCKTGVGSCTTELVELSKLARGQLRNDPAEASSGPNQVGRSGRHHRTLPAWPELLINRYRVEERIYPIRWSFRASGCWL
jgi:hypothetical protein